MGFHADEHWEGIKDSAAVKMTYLDGDKNISAGFTELEPVELITYAEDMIIFIY